jgi:superfamily II DNA or RNA helicase
MDASSMPWPKAMLTEGWDCNTVTHIVGLRPFMSQLLCEQVVGRGLRRSTYDIGDDGKLSEGEAAGRHPMGQRGAG